MSIIKRTIMIFPEFENIGFINELRNKYDPLADKVHPHITLVFPFESDLTTSEVYRAIDNCLSTMQPFQIEARELSTSGRWLFIDIKNGTDVLSSVHNALYENGFSKYKPVWLREYKPHITVGVFGTKEEAENACE